MQCRQNKALVQNDGGSEAANDFARLVELNKPVFMVALYYALGLKAQPNAFKRSGAIIQFMSEPSRLSYPLQRRYKVSKGYTAGLDVIIKAVPARLANLDDFKLSTRDGDRVGIILLICEDNIQLLKLQLPSTKELRDAARSIAMPLRSDWALWLDKAISENFQANIKLPNSIGGN
ncbi:hypothetical protein CONPUDRAFT_135344 [Coniophora puteana RWD-64-598 SS2]|uniref:Uncharacterized protein n=1 Tax=Coniophora puteana (strain RWD-64-598) TaxID=741705 RepID=A0A5M3N2Y6_CONPW|nr:uncharacterized protein CONPUDRAFT_135344 [Coniophora puteana RWD-64-598 SS2]EIW85733.1 hypothetical protein CONPUDRAFT_135344 [Coniophora puteana RWD-64-598 SS2]